MSTLQVDTINESTSASGVTIDGVLIKDSEVTSGAGMGQFIKHQTFSSVTEVDIDDVFTTTYDNYLISGTLERGDTAGTYMRLLKSSDGSERSSDYYMTDFSTNTDDTTPDYSNSNGVSTFYIGRGSGSEAGADTWFKLWIKDPMGAANTYMEGTLFGYHDSRDNYSSHNLMGHNTVSEQHRGFKLVANSDNITAYNVKVWGLVNS